MSEQSDTRDLGPVDEHHTPEQVAKAFAYAPTVLRELTEAGVSLPSLQLFADGSGRLKLAKQITAEQAKLAYSLVQSQRVSMFADEIVIDFCCGLVLAAEQAG